MMLNTRSCMLHGVEANSHSSSCDEVAKNKFYISGVCPILVVNKYLSILYMKVLQLCL